MSFVIKQGDTIEQAVNEGLLELGITEEQGEITVLEQPSKGFLGILGGRKATVKIAKKTSTEDILNEILHDRPAVKKESPRVTEPEQNVVEKVREKAPEKEAAAVSSQKIDPVVEKTEDFRKEKPVEEKVSSPEPAVEQNLKRSSKKETPYTDEEEEKVIEEFLKKVLNPLEVEYTVEISRENQVLAVNIQGDPKGLGIVIGKRGVTLDAIQYLLRVVANRGGKYKRVTVNAGDYREKREETLVRLAHRCADKVKSGGRSYKLDAMNPMERRIIHSTLQDVEGITTYSVGKDPYRKVVIRLEEDSY